MESWDTRPCIVQGGGEAFICLAPRRRMRVPALREVRRQGFGMRGGSGARGGVNRRPSRAGRPSKSARSVL
eukprot:1648077-Prymnesium_polylepis.1